MNYSISILDNINERKADVINLSLDDLCHKLTSPFMHFLEENDYEKYHLLKEMQKAAKLEAMSAQTQRLPNYKELNKHAKDYAGQILAIKNGKAFLPYMYSKPKSRMGKDITGQTLIVLDLDDGPSADTVHNILKDFEYVIYTSFSHTKEKPRYRVVLFPDSILKREDAINLTMRIDAHFPDLNPLSSKVFAIDPVGLKEEQLYFLPAWLFNHPEKFWFYRNTGMLVSINDFQLTLEQQEKLDTKHAQKSWQKKLSQDIPQQVKDAAIIERTKYYLNPDYMLNTEIGYIRVGDITDHISGVACPFHNDVTGNEFVKVSKSGTPYLRCKHCGTIWMKRDETDSLQKIFGKKEVVDKEMPLFDYGEDRLFEPMKTQEERYVELENMAKEIFVNTNEGHGFCLFAPEGYGKSYLVVPLLLKRKKILFGCQSGVQAESKTFDDIKQWITKDERTKDKEINFVWSCEYNFWHATGKKIKLCRQDPFLPFDMGNLDSKKTVEKIMDVCGLNEKVAKQFLKDNYTEIKPPTMDFVNNDVIVTTFAQIQFLVTSGKYKEMGPEWVIIFDDPSITDITRFKLFDDVLFARLKNENERLRLLNQKEYILPEIYDIKNKTGEVIKQYFIKPEQSSLGYNFKTYRYKDVGKWITPTIIFTTTEWLTRHLIELHHPKIKTYDFMSDIDAGNITMFGSDLVIKKYHAIFPVITKYINIINPEKPLTFFGNGLGQPNNLVNTKGRNNYKDTNTLIKISQPHPFDIENLLYEFNWLGKDNTWTTQQIAGIIMLDAMHQMIGRNSGYRYNGNGVECIIIVYNHFFKSIKNACRYKLSDNSTQISSSKNLEIRKAAKNEWYKIANNISKNVDILYNVINDIEKMLESEEFEKAYLSCNFKEKTEFVTAAEFLKGDLK